MTSLGEKLVARLKPADVACFVPPYLAEVYRARTAWPVNDPQASPATTCCWSTPG